MEMTNLVQRSLTELENVIRSGFETFVAVGNALLEIRDRRLYREQGFGTFEDYCRERWQMSRIHAHRMIDAAGVAENLLPRGNTPQNERQCRELAALAPEEQREVAAAIDFQKATAADVRAEVEKHIPKKTGSKKRLAQRESKAPKNSKYEPRLLEIAAMPQPVSLKRICMSLGWQPRKDVSSDWRKVTRQFAWVHVEKSGDRKELSYTVTIDHELKHICDGEESPRDFCRRLWRELKQRRKEADLRKSSGGWVPENIDKANLIAIFVWIEGELEAFNNGQSANGRERADRTPRLNGRGESYGEKDQIRTAATQ